MLGVPALAAIAVFVGAYVLFVFRERHQLLIAGVAALAVMGLGLVSVSSLLPTGWSGRGGVVEWDTLGLLLGLFLFAGTLRELGLFRRIARRLARRLRRHARGRARECRGAEHSRHCLVSTKAAGGGPRLL